MGIVVGMDPSPWIGALTLGNVLGALRAAISEIWWRHIAESRVAEGRGEFVIGYQLRSEPPLGTYVSVEVPVRDFVGSVARLMAETEASLRDHDGLIGADGLQAPYWMYTRLNMIGIGRGLKLRDPRGVPVWYVDERDFRGVRVATIDDLIRPNWMGDEHPRVKLAPIDVRDTGAWPYTELRS